MASTIIRFFRQSAGFLSPVSSLVKRISDSEMVSEILQVYGVRLVVYGLGITISIITSRLLGPVGRGFFASAFFFAGLGIQFGNLGLHASNTYFSAQKPDLVATLYSNSVAVSTIVGGIIGIFSALVFLMVPEVFPFQGSLLFLAVFYIPLGLVVLLLQNLALGMKEIRAFNISELATRGCQVAGLGIFFLAENISPQTIFMTVFMGTLGAFAVLHRALFPRIGTWKFPSFQVFKENFGYGLKAYLGALFAFIALRVSVFQIQRLLGPRDTGLFSVALTITDFVMLLPITIGTLLFPRLCRINNARSKWDLTLWMATLVFCAMTVVCLFLGFHAKPCILFLFGTEFALAERTLQILMAGLVLLSVNSIFMNYFASLGMPWITVISPGCAAIVNFVVGTVTIPIIGLKGAALSTVMAYTTMFLFSLFYLFFWRKSDLKLI